MAGTPIRARLRSVALLFALSILTGCGTGMACGNKFGAPPERDFWCSPVSDLGKYFQAPPKVVPPKQAPVTCIPTLGDGQCSSAAPATM